MSAEEGSQGYMMGVDSSLHSFCCLSDARFFDHRGFNNSEIRGSSLQTHGSDP